MRLPKTISPCPIKEAVAEFRFDSDVPPDAVFGIAYQSLKKDFSDVKQFPIASLPQSIRLSDPNFIFQPHFRLENETSVVSLGPKVISVGIRGDYPGWETFSQRIRGTFAQFNESGITTKPLRLGLRFISFFPYNIFSHLQLKITLDNEALEGEETHFKTVLAKPSHKTLLQIGKGFALVGNPNQPGSVIDIDSFTTEITGGVIPALETFLTEAHQTEKELFFRLLKPEFLASLNPVY
jgi:uncharacterized protein (TIGR04255 family)